MIHHLRHRRSDSTTTATSSSPGGVSTRFKKEMRTGHGGLVSNSSSGDTVISVNRIKN